MNRRELLQTMALAGLGAVMLPLLKACRAQGASRMSDDKGNCVLIPEETAGPFTMDLSQHSDYLRREITEGRAGIPLSLTLTIVNVNDGCKPLANARVDVWHCDKDGVYSGFDDQFSGADAARETFMRGIQITDKNGQVTFETIYPGWYYGRVTHIHFQVFLNNGLVATSQIAFPEDVTKQVYETGLYAGRGQNPSVESNAQDGVFRRPAGALPRELCTLAQRSSGGYDAALNVGIAV